MNGLFSFHRKDKPSFEIREECLEQIEMLGMAKEPLGIVDDIQTGYDDPRWIEKSNSIKARDNYTCQLCHAFNPMQEGLVFVQQGKYETYHQYITDRSSYIIHVKDFEFTINFDFYSGFHLAMPRLNVHHKVYFCAGINRKEYSVWDILNLEKDDMGDYFYEVCEVIHNNPIY